MKMRIEVLALIVMGLVVLGVHAMDMDWQAFAENWSHSHPMSLMYIDFNQ